MRSEVKHEALATIMPDTMEPLKDVLKRYVNGEYGNPNEAVADLLQIADAFDVSEWTE